MKKIVLAVAVLLLMCACNSTYEKNVLAGKTICIDPGHGGTAETDTFRVGPSGEREEWIDLRVALYLQKMLEAEGAEVVMTRTEDKQVGLKERADMAKEANADVFLSIHHNATADTAANFPIVYFHGNASENKAGVKLGKILAKNLAGGLFDGETPYSLVSDLAIFPGSGTAVLRHSYGIPGVIGEASFFSNPEEELRLKDALYNRKEAEIYLVTLKEFFAEDIPGTEPKNSLAEIPPFEALQEGERMQETAKRWLEDFTNAVEYMNNGKKDKAEELFIRSARSFPDSYVAGEAHLYLSELTSDSSFATSEKQRVREHYPGTRSVSIE